MPIDADALATLRKDTEALWGEAVVEQWAPPWADHCIGLFAVRKVSDVGYEPQRYRCYCFVCRTEHRGECITGAVRSHVTHFAAAHLHRDPMAVMPRQR